MMYSTVYSREESYDVSCKVQYSASLQVSLFVLTTSPACACLFPCACVLPPGCALVCWRSDGP